ncbi:MAG: F0F1 ATP synthase subunit delta [Pyrinomonadaceae bacterium]|nr:F0F1 ATP synthase subunit delta [Pyrinomonadaceae bacterium]
MKTIRQIKRDARHLFRLCLVNGVLEQDHVRQVVQSVLGAKRRGYLALATEFERLVRLERMRHTATVESATPLSADLQAEVVASLARLNGPGISTSFAVNPALIGGMRIKVASDLYDGSLEGGLAALENSF